MASMVLAAAPSVSSQLHNSSSRLSFSHSEVLTTPLRAPIISLSASAISFPSPVLSVYCGRGDRKTEKGKRFSHSFGNARPRNKKKGRGPPRIFAPPDLTKKEKFQDKEVLDFEFNEPLSSD